MLDILKGFSYEMGLNPVPTTLLSLTDPTILQYLHTLYAIGRDLRQAKCWVQLKRTHSITTTAGTTAYALPDDFYAALLDTTWNTTQKWKLRGPLSDSRFNELLYGYGVYTNQTSFRIFGRADSTKFSILPDPPTGNVIKFDYLSKNWIDNAGTFSETVTSDAAVASFDDDLLILGLKWKWLQTKGLSYEVIKAEYDDKIIKAQARWKGDRKVSLSSSDFWSFNPNIPEGNF